MAEQRLDKVLAALGIGTRKEVKKICKAGLVKINDQIIKDSSTKLDPDLDTITYAGEVLSYQDKVYIMLNKPAGVISATVDDLHTTVIDILPEEIQVRQPFPIGRLDKDTEGLLIITNDGKFSHQLTAPKKDISKIYYVELAQAIDEHKLQQLASGVELDDGYLTKPAKVAIYQATADEQQLFDIEKLRPLIPEQVVNKSCQQRLLIAISEGRYHQIKRMATAVGSEVIYLKRLTIGDIVLDSTLLPGEWRAL